MCGIALRWRCIYCSRGRVVSGAGVRAGDVVAALVSDSEMRVDICMEASTLREVVLKAIRLSMRLSQGSSIASSRAAVDLVCSLLSSQACDRIDSFSGF